MLVSSVLWPYAETNCPPTAVLQLDKIGMTNGLERMIRDIFVGHDWINRAALIWAIRIFAALNHLTMIIAGTSLGRHYVIIIINFVKMRTLGR